MKSVIEELFNGNVRPIKEFQPILESYKLKWEKTMKKDNTFIGKLDEDLRREFEQLMDDHFDLIPLEMSEVYTMGFKMGARLTCEVFSDENE